MLMFLFYLLFVECGSCMVDGLVFAEHDELLDAIDSIDAVVAIEAISRLFHLCILF